MSTPGKFKASQLVRRVFPSALAAWHLIKLAVGDHSFLRRSGWFEAARRGHPCDSSGAPLPWMTYDAINLLSDRLTPALHLFEFGSGFSTSYFAQRVGQVVSIEYDRDWSRRVRAMVGSNVDIRDIDCDDAERYVAAVLDGNQYNVIVIDGRHRNRCAAAAIEALADDGVVVFDDSDRERYRAGGDLLRDAGFRSLRFRGLKPFAIGECETTVFYRPGNCLGL